MLKECRVICGTTFEISGVTKDVNLMHFLKFEDQVTEEFGGYTMSLSVGAWRDPEGKVIREAVRVYDIAIEADQTAYEPLLRYLATQLRTRANQRCVYFRDTDGVVTFI